MPTHNDETLRDRYAREHADHMARLAKMTPEQIAEMELSLHNALAENAALRAQLPSQGGEAVALSVWYGPMPESNGKSNYTALLYRKGESLYDGTVITLDRSEYPDRVRYEADRVRYLIGELDAEPSILDYDPDKHSGYTHQADKVAEGVAPLLKAAIKHIDSQVFYKFGEPVTKADREGRRIADELRQLLAKSEVVKS